MDFDTPHQIEHFPTLNDSHHFFNNKNNKKYNSNLTQVSKKKKITLPA